MDMLRFHKFTIGWALDRATTARSDDPEEFKALAGLLAAAQPQAGHALPRHAGHHRGPRRPRGARRTASSSPPPLQAAQAGDAPVLIRIETKAGHGAGKPTTKIIEEYTDLWSFALDRMGLGGN